MSTAKRLHYSNEEYESALEMSELKLEYCDGVIYAIARGTIAHGQLSAAAIGILRQSLLARCNLFTSDVKIRVEASDLSTFPDASVVCGEILRSAIDKNAVTNPTILVEVTSKSTEDYDRGDKLSHYKQLPALKAVLIISHRKKAITLIERTPQGWDEREARAGEKVALAEPALSFPVDDVYAGVELEPA